MGEKQYSLWIDLFWLGTLWLARGRDPIVYGVPVRGQGRGANLPREV